MAPHNPRLKGALTPIAGLLIGLWIMLPLWMAAILSIKPPAAFFTASFLPWIDFAPTLANWRAEARNFWYPSGMGPALGNSLLVGALAALGALLLDGGAAWALRQLRLKRRTEWLIFLLLILPRMIPPVVTALPYATLTHLRGWDDTHAALICAHITLLLPWTFLILSSALHTIPQELLDAAALDGANARATLRRVVLPLILPALLAAWTLCFALSWNEFLYAALNAQAHLTTAPVAVSQLFTKDAIEFNFVGSHLVLAMTPPLLLALAGRRVLTRALSLGALE